MAITKEVNIVVKESGLDEVNKKVNKLETSVDSLEKQQRSLSKSMGDSFQSVLDNGGAMGLLNDVTGGLAMTVKDAVEASVIFTRSQKISAIQQAITTTVVGASTGAMKAFRISLAATGVGLLVIGLVLLIANFDKVKKAVTNFLPGLASIGDFIGNIVDSFTDFIGVTSEAEREMKRMTAQADKSLAMNKKYLQEEGDLVNKYTKAKIDAKNAYNESLKEEGANQIALAKRLNRELLAIDKMREDDLGKVRKESQDKINAENEKATQKKIDDDKKAEEKRLQKIEENSNIAREKGENARKQLEDLEQQQKEARKRNDDALKTENELKVEAENVEFEAKKQRFIYASLSIEEIEKEHQRKLSELSNEYFAGEAEKSIKKDADNKKTKEDEIAREQAVADAKSQIANSVFDLIGMFAKKGSKLAKGVAVAQATMNTYNGITSALAAPSTVPEPFGTALKIANSATIGAMGFINVKKILSTNEQGDSGSGGGSSGGSSSSTPAPSFNLVQGTNTNQIANSISKQAPLKAYVVSRDMSTSQEADRNLVKSATL